MLQQQTIMSLEKTDYAIVASSYFELNAFQSFSNVSSLAPDSDHQISLNFNACKINGSRNMSCYNFKTQSY